MTIVMTTFMSQIMVLETQIPMYENPWPEPSVPQKRMVLFSALTRALRDNLL